MFLISINQDDEPKLHTSGLKVRINGQPQNLKMDDEYLTYGKNRCKILSTTNENGLLSFVCASHGAEKQPHVIVELCSKCGGQRGSCDCDVDAPSQAAWAGDLPVDESHERVIALIIERWNSSATCTAVDAVEDLLEESDPDLCAPMIRAICRLSRWWTEQIASDLLGVPNEESGDFKGLARALATARASRT